MGSLPDRQSCLLTSLQKLHTRTENSMNVAKVIKRRVRMNIFVKIFFISWHMQAFKRKTDNVCQTEIPWASVCSYD